MSNYFGTNFMGDHAGQIVTDPKVAIMELVANCSDAGSTAVEIFCPTEGGKELSVKDNGVGMSKGEFEARWNTINFDRRKTIGKDVVYPPDVTTKPNRKLYGKSGKGRHAGFCFSDTYQVITSKNGNKTIAKVSVSISGDAAFNVEIVNEEKIDASIHGTEIKFTVDKSFIEPDTIKELIGSKFLMDPSFNVFVNKDKINFADLGSISTESIKLSEDKIIEVLIIDSELNERSNRLRGVAWWVNNRLVGVPSWKNLLGDMEYVDGRSKAAKRYGFIVKTDFLDTLVKEDWSGFKNTSEVQEASTKVDEFIVNKISEFLKENRREMKLEILEENKSAIYEMTTSSRLRVGEFIDEIQKKCTTMKASDISNAVEVFSNLEKSRNGYDLLRQLSLCGPDDLDRWTEIIRKWDSKQAEIILEELERRIKLVDDLQRLVHDKKADELHDLQPLFEKGLWIFGPKYESIEYASNKTLKNIVENFLNGDSTKLTVAANRPDVVTSPIGAWDSPRFNEDGEVIGADKVLILELKKGGFNITQDELNQALKYATELKNANAVEDQTSIECFVLGSTQANRLSQLDLKDQRISVVPRTYEGILKQANARLFNLRKRLVDAGFSQKKDSDVEVVATSGVQTDMQI